MKKSLKNAICLLALVAITAPTFGAIGGTQHDFTGDAWASNLPCSPCHTPHAGAVQTAPLWNHAVSGATFTMYNNTNNANMGADLDGAVDAAPTGTSLLCLSCHDGVTNMDAFGDNLGTTAMLNTAPGYIGTDLTLSHPIGITYTTATATADGTLHNPAVQTSGLGSTIDADLLVATKVECSSCHDVHNDSSIAKLLRIDMTGDALCVTCHNK